LQRRIVIVIENVNASNWNTELTTMPSLILDSRSQIVSDGVGIAIKPHHSAHTGTVFTAFGCSRGP